MGTLRPFSEFLFNSVVFSAYSCSVRRDRFSFPKLMIGIRFPFRSHIDVFRFPRWSPCFHRWCCQFGVSRGVTFPHDLHIGVTINGRGYGWCYREWLAVFPF